MKWERQGAGNSRELLHAGEKNFYDTLKPLNFIDKNGFKEEMDIQLSLIESGNFPDEDFKNRMMSLRDQVLALDEGYTIETVEEMYRRKIDEIFPEPLGTVIRERLVGAYRDNEKTDWKTSFM